MHIKGRRHKSLLTSKPKKPHPIAPALQEAPPMIVQEPFDGLEGEVRRMRPDTLTIRPEYEKDHPDDIKQREINKKLKGLPKPKFYY